MYSFRFLLTILMNDLHLILEKCAVMSISNKRASNNTIDNYYYGDYTFRRVNEQRDLGVL